MHKDIDPNLADKLQFHVNHRKKLIESNDPDIYMRDRGGTLEPNILYFTLHWCGREIPARVHQHARSIGRNSKAQLIREVHWTIQHIGNEDYAVKDPATLYTFQSKQEHICAAHLILKALAAYGGTFNETEYDFSPEYSKITTTLSDGLKKRMYGDIN
jgi:hypothetical protein